MSMLNETETRDRGPDALGALNKNDRADIEKLLRIATTAATARRIDLQRLDAQASNAVRWLLHRLLRERCHIVFTDLKRRIPETRYTLDLRNRLFEHIAITPPIGFERVNAADCQPLIKRLVDELEKDSVARSEIKPTDLTYLR
jgi:hypothetical protein